LLTLKTFILQTNLFFKKILTSFSYFFHPIFVPTMACGLFLLSNDCYTNFNKFDVIVTLFQVTVLTIFLPLSIYYLLKSLGKVDDIMVSKLSHRKLPLAIQAFLIMVLVRFGITEDRIPELYYFFISGLVATFLLLILAFVNVKASIHLVGMASLLFFTIGLSLHTHKNFLNSICVLLLLTGFVASSRIAMKAHSISELSIGFFTGMFSQLVLWWFWL
jgi:hypothetical protein